MTAGAHATMAKRAGLHMVWGPDADGVALVAVGARVGSISRCELPNIPEAMSARVVGAWWWPKGNKPMLLVSVYGFTDATAQQRGDLRSAIEAIVAFAATKAAPVILGGRPYLDVGSLRGGSGRCCSSVDRAHGRGHVHSFAGRSSHTGGHCVGLQRGSGTWSATRRTGVRG